MDDGDILRHGGIVVSFKGGEVGRLVDGDGLVGSLDGGRAHKRGICLGFLRGVHAGAELVSLGGFSRGVDGGFGKIHVVCKENFFI